MLRVLAVLLVSISVIDTASAAHRSDRADGVFGAKAKPAAYCRNQREECISEMTPHNQKHPSMINECSREYDRCLHGGR